MKWFVQLELNAIGLLHTACDRQFRMSLLSKNLIRFSYFAVRWERFLVGLSLYFQLQTCPATAWHRVRPDDLFRSVKTFFFFRLQRQKRIGPRARGHFKALKCVQQFLILSRIHSMQSLHICKIFSRIHSRWKTDCVSKSSNCNILVWWLCLLFYLIFNK